MKISGVKFEVSVNVVCGEFKDEKEFYKELNLGAHVGFELGEAEASPEETVELIHSAMDMARSELKHQYEHQKEMSNKKDDEIANLRCVAENQHVELSHLKGQMD